MQYCIILLLTFLFTSCASNESAKIHSRDTAIQVKVKYENIPLKAPSEWIGGTKANPRYYTEQGEEIITPLIGVDIVPVTKRSVDKNGKVLYPHSGFQVTGDLRLDHYLLLMKKISGRLNKVSKTKAVEIVADSNFLEKGASIFDESGKLVEEYEFKALSWYVKQ